MLTGNNINHPNDYLAQWYAHIVSEILIPERTFYKVILKNIPTQFIY